MLRRSILLCSGGLKEYHEWNLRELILQNYEGWRILDNPSYENKLDAYFKDMGGFIRHLDPIIDDPRLTHKQRVCRLYRWAIKEMQMYVSWELPHKSNMGYKVIRNRFEKYRFVTDPAMCDMMVRQTQKYLREICADAPFRRNSTSPGANAHLANYMRHPDHCQIYDHWTPPEVVYYDDYKLDRYVHHFPAFSDAWEMGDRYGIVDEYKSTEKYWIALYLISWAFGFYYLIGGPTLVFDDTTNNWYETLSPSVKYALIAEERRDRVKQSVLHGNWDYIVGHVKPITGYMKYNYNSLIKEKEK